MYRHWHRMCTWFTIWGGKKRATHKNWRVTEKKISLSLRAKRSVCSKCHSFLLLCMHQILIAATWLLMLWLAADCCRYDFISAVVVESVSSVRTFRFRSLSIDPISNEWNWNKFAKCTAVVYHIGAPPLLDVCVSIVYEMPFHTHMTDTEWWRFFGFGFCRFYQKLVPNCSKLEWIGQAFRQSAPFGYLHML